MRPRLDDPAWLEAQYNNRARVADAMAQLAGWAEASQRARDGSARKRLDIAYGDGPSETLDIFPAAAPDAPVLVYVHGGYWRSLDKSDFSFVAPSFVAGGAMVVLPNYALCPAVTIEDIALQMVKALAWTWRHAAEHGGNPQRMALVGHSAGGHLAAMLLSCRWKQVGEDLPLQPLAGALAISGLYDLEPLRLTEFLQADLKLTPSQVARCSPGVLPTAQGRQAVRDRRRRREPRSSCATTSSSAINGARRQCRCAKPFPARTTSPSSRAWPTRRAACTTWRCAWWICADL